MNVSLVRGALSRFVFEPDVFLFRVVNHLSESAIALLNAFASTYNFQMQKEFGMVVASIYFGIRLDIASNLADLVIEVSPG